MALVIDRNLPPVTLNKPQKNLTLSLPLMVKHVKAQN
jgi:hypothetical protein